MELLKLEPEKQRFQYLPRSPADVNVSENHVWSLLLHKNILSLENASKNFFVHIMPQKGSYLQTFWKLRFQGKW